MGSGETVLVTGANGFVGSHLVEHLLARGYRVRALVRRTSDLRFLPREAEVVRGDVTRPLSLPPALEGVRQVHHVAGVVGSFRRRTYREVNAEGTRNLARACRKVAVDLERFVLVSSLAAVGPSPGGRPVRETDVPRPVSEYGRSKLLGERAVLALREELPVTIVRPPIVYGPRDSDLLTLFQAARRGLVPTFPRDKFYSILHVRDLARGIRMAAESKRARGRIYHLAGPRAFSMRRLLDLIARAVGTRPRFVPVPDPVLRLAGPVSDSLAVALSLPLRPLEDKVREMLPDFWIADPEAARRDLGFTTEIPLAAGLAETASFYFRIGWLPPPAGGG